MPASATWNSSSVVVAKYGPTAASTRARYVPALDGTPVIFMPLAESPGGNVPPTQPEMSPA